MARDIKLLPCPFCGEEADLVEQKHREYPSTYYVRCKMCHCKSHERVGAGIVIEVWNTRKPKVLPIANVTFNKEDMQKMVDEKVKAIEIDIQAIKNETLNNLVEELEKVPTEYSHEEYNKAIRDVIKFVERTKRQVKNNE